MQPIKETHDSGNRLEFFLKLMDKVDALRMLVCILPGIVIAKVVALPSMPQASKIIGGIALAIGIGVFFGWHRFRKLGREDAQDEEVNDALPDQQTASSKQDISIPAGEHIKMLMELKQMCGGDFDEVMNLLQTESAIHPNLTLPAVIEEAYRRRSYVVRNRSGS